MTSTHVIRGARVRVIREIRDDWTTVPEGSTGTVTFIDGLGTIFVEWDRGGNLGIVPHLDAGKYLIEKEKD